MPLSEVAVANRAVALQTSTEYSHPGIGHCHLSSKASTLHGQPCIFMSGYMSFTTPFILEEQIELSYPMQYACRGCALCMSAQPHAQDAPIWRTVKTLFERPILHAGL